MTVHVVEELSSDSTLQLYRLVHPALNDWKIEVLMISSVYNFEHFTNPTPYNYNQQMLIFYSIDEVQEMKTTDYSFRRTFSQK